MTGDGVIDPLIVIRAIHFAATAMTTGTILFQAMVAGAALHSAETLATVVRTQIRRLAWIGLAITAVSGAIWILLEAAAMSGLPFSEAVTSEVLLTVVNDTQFGRVFEIRFVLAMILAACLAYDRFPLARWLALASALGLVAAIAWTGHAGSTVGEMGLLHLTADALHLIAAAAWTGSLVPFVWLLVATRRYQQERMDTACTRCDTTLLDVRHRQRSHPARQRHRQRVDAGRLRRWSDRDAIWASPDAQDRLIRRYGGICGC